MKQNPDKQFAAGLRRTKFCFQFLITLVLAQFLVASDAWCQLMTNNGTGITITSGVQVTVRGDIQNNAGTSINNNGTIDLSGNWTHNAANNCFGTSTGTVIFNGANQAIGGTNSTTFNNLTLQGSGTKTILINTTSGGANAIPSGILNVGNVVLDLNSRSLNISNAATGAITYGTGYILSEDVDNSSKVNWTINNVTGTHTIPFGNTAGVQIPLTFNLTSGNAGDVTVSTYASAPNNTPLPVTPIPVTHVRNNSGFDNSANTVDRFWEIDPSGSGINAALTFTYAPSENAAGGNLNMRAQGWNLPQEAWETPLAGQVNPTSQSVLVSNVTTFGPWAIATEDSPLPIELISFTATVIDNKEILCKWITATEINNDYFTVERSRDGNEFEEAGKMDGAGNSTSVLNYSLTDYTPYKGISYYRLKQTDFNGDYSYSQVVAVKIFEDASDILIYPNPSNGIFNIIKNNMDVPVELFMYDMEGRLVWKNRLTDGSMQIDIRNFGKGVYNLQSAAEGLNKNFRVVVQ
ncbi:MAG TPA: T9SS type A sorting domain-containing protein [Bacteroidia bacterium]|nr:T9SS type A sorting domain-containing protein [Bacteroidia bacterium]